MSFHPGQSFTFGETPSATKWNYLWENDYALADGTGISDNAIDSRHYTDASIDPEHIDKYDWFKLIPGHSYSSVISGTWIQIGNSGTGTITPLTITQSNGTINEEIEYKTVLHAGTYKLLLNTDKDVNRGIYTIYIDGVSVGTYDSYAGTRVVSVIAVISTSITITTTKEVTIRLKMASKNASSSGYYATFSELTFVRTA